MFFKVRLFFSNRDVDGICNCVDDSNITTSFKSEDGKWCCRYGKEDCMIDKYYIERTDIDQFDFNKLDFKYVKVVTCSGKTLPLSQQCHDGDDTTPVCNYVHSNPLRNIRAVKKSYLDVCKDNL